MWPFRKKEVDSKVLKAPDPRIKYGTKVRIVGGFFAGQTGVLVNKDAYSSASILFNVRFGNESVWVREHEFKVL